MALSWIGMESLAPVLAVLLGGAAIFVVAVWFGLSILAPRIGRAADRADTDEEEPGDRPD
jgi:hypothetical protein